MSDGVNAAAFEFQKALMPLQAEGFLDSESASLVTFLFREHLEKYNNNLSEDIHKRARAWEQSVGEDDPSLYTLGLRHASDIIRGESPDRFLIDGTGVKQDD